MDACLPRSIVYRYRILCKLWFNLLLARATLMKLWPGTPFPSPYSFPSWSCCCCASQGSPKMACGRGASVVAAVAWLPLFGFMHKIAAHKCTLHTSCSCRDCNYGNSGNTATLLCCRGCHPVCKAAEGLNPILRC